MVSCIQECVWQKKGICQYVDKVFANLRCDRRLEADILLNYQCGKCPNQMKDIKACYTCDHVKRARKLCPHNVTTTWADGDPEMDAEGEWHKCTECGEVDFY